MSERQGSGPAPSRDERVATRPRYAGLDGLRAFAVVAVLLFHFDVTPFAGGFLGVDVFFVISGFLITSLLLHEYASTGRIGLVAFYGRRARRLLPALVLVVVASVVACMLVWRDALADVRADAIAASVYLSNWWYVVDDKSYAEATGRPSMLQHLWSLGVEEQFYLLWPLAVGALLAGTLLVRRAWRGGGAAEPAPVSDEQVHRIAVVAAVGAVTSTALMAFLAIRSDVPFGTGSARVYLGTDTHAMGLMVGAALACGVFLVERREPRLPPVVRGPWWSDLLGVLAFVALLVIVVRTTLYSEALYRGGFLVVTTLTAVVIASALRRGSVVAAAFGTGVLVWIGVRSYAIYLCTGRSRWSRDRRST